MGAGSSSLEIIAGKLFEVVANTFPVASSSDEFFYFPQVPLDQQQENRWDCFSSNGVKEFAERLSGWENDLQSIKHRQSETSLTDLDQHIDVSLLLKVVRTLREQLTEVRPWEYQPTWYLTIAGIGMAQAIESENPAAKHERAERLSAFLDQARHTLKCVPVLFRNLSLEMIPRTKKHFHQLEVQIPELKTALEALDRFEDFLYSVSTCDSFHLSQDLVQRIVRFHIKSDMEMDEINKALDQEIHEMEQRLCQEATRIGAGLSWEDAYEKIPLPDHGKTGLIGIYENQVKELGAYCLAKGFVSPRLFSTCPVKVAPMPSYLSTIRTASSYSIQPKSHPAGGTFYLINGCALEKPRREYHREYRMLSAHETYPGHHLLDASRWNLERAFRRSIEQPIFYEGWACFAEELLRRTGYFSQPADSLLLAKRRLWRAIRGKADIGLQTGALDIPTAARYLSKAGMSLDQATASVIRYLLNPGYQLCYSLGIRRFIDLFDRYGYDDLPGLVRFVLGQGEINFDDLERSVQQGFRANA